MHITTYTPTSPFSSTTPGNGGISLPQIFPPPPAMTPLLLPSEPSPSTLSLDARPNPRFQSHMPAIFTNQWKQEQELEEERRIIESQKKLHAAQVKHTVTVYAWSEESEPATIQDFQEGTFTWPFFPLSSSLLSALSLSGPETRVQLYRKKLGTWVTVCEGYVIELQEGARVFLKAGNVVDCQDFDKLLEMEAMSVPHLRYNLVGERRELRERYRNKSKGKGKSIRSTQADTSSSDEGIKYKSTIKQTPSQRQFRKQTLPASLFLPTASPSSSVNIISSDDSSSRTPYPSGKRKLSKGKGAFLALKRRCVSPSYANDSTSVIELSDSDGCPCPLTATSVKIEPPSDVLVPRHWPGDFYAVDIVNFFGACETNSTVQMETIFCHHFPNISFRRSTVNENRARWKKAPQLVRDNVLRAKYTAGGKWSVFQMKTRKGGKV